jgi:hypothetical protein
MQASLKLEIRRSPAIAHCSAGLRAPYAGLCLEFPVRKDRVLDLSRRAPALKRLSFQGTHVSNSTYEACGGLNCIGQCLIRSKCQTLKFEVVCWRSAAALS